MSPIIVDFLVKIGLHIFERLVKRKASNEELQEKFRAFAEAFRKNNLESISDRAENAEDALVGLVKNAEKTKTVVK